MRADAECRACRIAWMRAFDSGRPMPGWVRLHLEACRGCRSFGRTSERVRYALRAAPAPAPDPQSDRQLLSRFEAEGPPERLPRPALSRAALSLLLPGAASFVATLALGAGLAASATSGTPPPPPAPDPAAAAALESGLDEWLTLAAPQSIVPPRGLGSPFPPPGGGAGPQPPASNT